jgi:hypothetical protein
VVGTGFKKTSVHRTNFAALTFQEENSNGLRSAHETYLRPVSLPGPAEFFSWQHRWRPIPETRSRGLLPSTSHLESRDLSLMPARYVSEPFATEPYILD